MEPLLFILLTFALNILVYSLLSWKFSRRERKERVIKELRDEINVMILELNQATERNVLIAEEKIKELSEIVRKTEDTLLLKGKEREKKEESMEIYREIGKKTQSYKAKKSPPKKSGEKGEDSLKSEEGEKGSHREEPLSPKESVISMNRQGLADHIIAKRVGLPLGEVRLIISMKETSL